MSQKEKINDLRNWFTLLNPKSFLRKVFETLKWLITGSPHLWFCMKRREIEFNKTLNIYGDLSILTKSTYVKFINMERSYIFGKKLTDEQNKAIKELQEKGVPDEDIRVLVVNGLLNKKGITIFSNKKELSAFFLGVIFLILCAIIFLLFTALVWFSPLTIFYEVLFQIGITLIIIYSSYVMSYFSIFPYKVMSRYK